MRIRPAPLPRRTASAESRPGPVIAERTQGVTPPKPKAA